MSDHPDLSRSVDLLGFLLPFTYPLWGVVVGYLVITGVLSYLFEKGNNGDLQAEEDDREGDGHVSKFCGRRLKSEQSAKLNVFYWVLANFSGIGSA